MIALCVVRLCIRNSFEECDARSRSALHTFMVVARLNCTLCLFVELQIVREVYFFLLFFIAAVVVGYDIQ